MGKGGEEKALQASGNDNGRRDLPEEMKHPGPEPSEPEPAQYKAVSPYQVDVQGQQGRCSCAAEEQKNNGLGREIHEA
jgi:hypothetical protein